MACPVSARMLSTFMLWDFGTICPEVPAFKEVPSMEKTRKQELADQEAMRLYREFHAPIPASPREREKPLDKVKEPPRASRSLEREER